MNMSREDADRQAGCSTQPETWIKSGCLVCEFTDHSGETTGSVRNGRCPNDGSILLRMEGLLAADDIITVARLLVKADREKREGQRSLVAARADLGRVRSLIDTRTVELASRP